MERGDLLEMAKGEEIGIQKGEKIRHSKGRKIWHSKRRKNCTTFYNTNLLNSGMKIDEISKITGLSIEEINDLLDNKNILKDNN